MISFTWDGKHVTPPTSKQMVTEKIIFPSGIETKAEPLGSLIHGDNFDALSALLPIHFEKVDLIYIDPPFYTNRKFNARVGKGEDSRKPKDWQLDHGYGDTWANLDEYIQFLYDRLTIAYQLLSPTGTIYVHLDWHADAYARLLLDEIFGADRLLNEIIWTYHGPSPIRTAFNRKHDTILCYTKSEKYTFNVDDVRTEYNQNTIKTFNSSTKAGFGKVPDLERGKVPEDWWYFPVVARLHSERTGYPTQKPEKLMERVIKASSNAGDLVLDFFSGSGTTAVVAAGLGRRFIGIDASPKAIHTAEERLTRLASAPFEINSLNNNPIDVQNQENLVTFDNDLIHLKDDREVFFWEIGFHDANGVFISLDQRTRPYRVDTIDTIMRLPNLGEFENLVVMVTMVNNEVFQQVTARKRA